MASKFLSFFKPAAKAVASDGSREQIERARALHQQGQLEAATTLYREILAAHPDNAEGHYRQANVLKDLGQLQAALAGYDRAIALKPDYAHAFCNRAVLLGLMQQLPEALASYDRAIELDPTDALAHCNRGALLIALGRKEAALASFDNAIAQRADFYPAHFSRGALLQERKDWAASLESYDRAIALNPGDAVTHYNRGTVLKELGKWDAALPSYDRAIALNEAFFRAHTSRAEVLEQVNQLSAALDSYDRAIELNPRDASTHNNRGIVLQKMGQFTAALAGYDQAIAAKPGYAEAYFNRGTVLKELGGLEAALASYERAIAARPDYADAYINRGTVLGAMGLLKESIASYRQAILIEPASAEAYYNLALGLLKAGDLKTGWINHEWRWRAQTGPIFKEKRDFSQPLWLGTDVIAGKTILLYGEQGLGDSLQFCRYAEMVAKLGARVVLEVPPRLVSLCTTLRGVARVIPYGDPLPDFDFQCPLMSLPLAFGTTLETIPATTGYVSSDAHRVATWQMQLGAKMKPRIGLTWSGNRVSGTNRKRHFPLLKLTPYLSDDFQYICLQTDIPEADQKTLAENPLIVHFSEGPGDFGATAALCECLDLVISVDTSIAHLSGALGRKTWVLLAFDADWRWLTDRDDSPWYPTMRLFRQKSAGDWNEVFERVAAELRKQFT
jgi:tetratricopeptide (TPR) repeat protein